LVEVEVDGGDLSSAAHGTGLGATNVFSTDGVALVD